ncbi:Mu transposase C-terminal domain-containing protein [Nodularia sp. UHCC 0506]|uniref:Mu transposase C-terminal domain-containing protein n=1 Tax=Nodularia sp. UHCC 0506 TaxID=3110243 RepID=UPI002B21329C|nr:Mu transposase C-terminal domain-containing protein [Nodularia sp. UHCC 0506]MEA5517195.1 Mu transposase C-terminal domain-containing protein [Nodularia sp. UHCC 0506]
MQPGQGIKVNYLYYWNDAFRNPAVEKTEVPMRYDTFDMGVAYAYLEGSWVKCISIICTKLALKTFLQQ